MPCQRHWDWSCDTVHTPPLIWLVNVGSGGVERNAIIGDNAEARKADIPIVQLNPGGTLNYKYMGEAAVRGTGLPYTVIRSTGVRLFCAAPCVCEDIRGGVLLPRLC